VENLAQSCAADFLTTGVVRAAKKGYKVAAVVHDQALAKALPGQSCEEFNALLCELPSWAPDFPLAAATSRVQFYTKD